jgi:hypothetical protein
MTETMPVGFALCIFMSKHESKKTDRIDVHLFKSNGEQMMIGCHYPGYGNTTNVISTLETELRILTKANYSIKRTLNEHNCIVYYMRVDDDKVTRPGLFSFHQDKMTDIAYLCWGSGIMVGNRIVGSSNVEEMTILTALVLNVPLTKLPPLDMTKLAT